MGIIAVFGGTFNPIHNGHREIIEEICKIDNVEKVIVIPTKIPPHKTVEFMADECDRVEMCRLATEDLPLVEVSEIELNREGKSYTIDTLSDLTQLYPDKDIAITIGADMVVTFDKWKEYKTILKLAKIITFSRTTTDYNEYINGLKLLNDCGADVIEVTRRISDISSSQVRKLLASRIDVSELIPDKVYSYIKNKDIYGA